MAGRVKIPETCPACGGRLRIDYDRMVKMPPLPRIGLMIPKGGWKSPALPFICQKCGQSEER